MKPGWKTSEFWLSLLTSALGIFALLGGHGVPPQVQGVIATAGAVLATGSTAAYAVSRGLAKSQSLTSALVAAPVEIVKVAVPARAATPMPPAGGVLGR